MTATPLPPDDPDVAKMLQAHAAQMLEAEGEDAVREQMRMLAESLVNATVHLDHLSFGDTVALTNQFIRQVLVANTGQKSDLADMFTCMFTEEAFKARAKLLGLPDPPGGLWDRWKAMLKATAEPTPDDGD